jgi:hypothetical protein
VRQWMYAWTYLQSETFRKLLRDSLEHLIEYDLSPENSVSLLENYKKINTLFFNGHYDHSIEDLENFLKTRPRELLRQLTNVEKRVASIDTETFNW